MARLASRIIGLVSPRLLWRLRAPSWTPPDSEPELVLLRALCDPGKPSVDIGASMGLYTLNMLGYSKACYAFEPRPAAAEALRKEYRGCRPPVFVEAVALSDRDGEARLRVCTADTGRSTLEESNPLDGFSGVEEIAVPLRRLDSYAIPAGCIKIDVEGHEEAVLRGARQTLIEHHPQLILECEERHNPGAPQRVRSFLEALGYRGFFFREGRLKPLESLDPGSRIINFVFVTPERTRRLRRWLQD
jgi:FkbM family methyltransferase